MNKELQFIDFPEEVTINPKKIESEKEEVKMKNPTKAPDISQGGGAFHEKKDKNKKINLGGPTKRKPPKTKPANRNQQKQKAKRKKDNNRLNTRGCLTFEQPLLIHYDKRYFLYYPKYK